jgi:chromosome segregation ATPase
LQASNKFVAQKLTEITSLKERCEIAEQGARSSAKALEQARAETATTYVRLDEERVHHANAQSRITALEAQLQDLSEKFAAARVDWSRKAEHFNQTIGQLQDQLGHTTGMDEARQRLLTTAQNDLSGLRLQIADLETRYAELRLVADQATAHAAHAETAREELAKDLLTSKRLQQSMLRRVKPLISALREKNGETTKLGATLADLEQRFQRYQLEAGEGLRSLSQKETQLVAELETERARRVVAEGALAIDRSFRPIETQKKRVGAAEE